MFRRDGKSAGGVRLRTRGSVDPEAALYGIWIEWYTSYQVGRPLSMGDTLRLTGERLANALRSTAPALLHALGTRFSAGDTLYLNQAGATYPEGVSELDAALYLLHLPEVDLEVGKITIFVQGAGEADPPVLPCVQRFPPGTHLVPCRPANH